MHQNIPHPLLRGARQAAERGWAVFPLVPGRKRPAVSTWERRATTDIERVDRCWASGAFNIGIAAGPSRLVVIDLDVPKHDQDRPPEAPDVTDGQDALAKIAEHYGEPYPCWTYTVRSVSGGRHLYFAAPAGTELRNTAGTLGWKIDTRACGGYVVGAGSIVDGKSYAVVRDEAPAPLPEWIAKLLTPAPLPPQRRVVATLAAQDRGSAYLAAAVGRELERITKARPGSRNNALYLASVALGQLVAGGELAAREVGDWLVPAAVGVGLTTREAQRTVDSGLRAGAKRPRTVNRGAAA